MPFVQRTDPVDASPFPSDVIGEWAVDETGFATLIRPAQCEVINGAYVYTFRGAEWFPNLETYTPTDSSTTWTVNNWNTVRRINFNTQETIRFIEAFDL